MEITTTTTTNKGVRQTSVTALAIVGFIALLLGGILLAIYSARFVPVALNRIGAAAVLLSSIFVPTQNPALEVVPIATTTITFEEPATSTTTPAELTVTTIGGAPATPVTINPVRGNETTQTFPGGTTAPAVLFGNSDLSVVITQVGYLRTDSSSSFVATSEIPRGEKVAAKFVVTNQGTNTTGSWKFEAKIPTSSGSTFTSPTQQALLPNDRIEYILGFDRAETGNDKRIVIYVDNDNDITENNEGNNIVSATVSVKR